MNKDAVKDIIYGGIKEIIGNRKYCYESFYPDNSKLTDEGKAVIIEFMELAANKIIEVERKELDRRAKDLVIDNLKGDNLKL